MSEIQFSRRTLVAAVNVIEPKYGDRPSLTRLFLTWGSEVSDFCDPGTIKDRFNHLIKFSDRNPEYITTDGGSLRESVTYKAVSLFPLYDSDLWEEPLQAQDKLFLHSLNIDGFSISDRTLRRLLPPELNLPEAEDEIRVLLNKHNFSVSTGHLNQAFENHTAGNWASANSQIRSFLDGLLDEIAARIDPSASTLGSGQPRRAKLATNGFLSKPLNEWDDGEPGKRGYINGLVSRLHPAGSHPGLSDPDDSTFRLHTVLLTARLLLVRFDAWP